jgi:hypothetical protein
MSFVGVARLLKTTNGDAPSRVVEETSVQEATVEKTEEETEGSYRLRHPFPQISVRLSITLAV